MKKKKYIQYIFTILFIFMIIGLTVQSDDNELFIGGTTGGVRPNVMVLFDNSGSMNNVIFYPKKGVDNILGTADDGYDPLHAYQGSTENFTSASFNYVSSTGWYARWGYIASTASNSRAYIPDDDNWNLNGKNYYTPCSALVSSTKFKVNADVLNFAVGDKVLYYNPSAPAIATVTAAYKSGVSYYLEIKDLIGNAIVAGHSFQKALPDGKAWKPAICRLYGTKENNAYETRYPGNYANWLFIYTNDTIRNAVTHFSTYATFDTTKTPAVVASNCNCSGQVNNKMTFTRIQTAREVICKVASDSRKIVKLGLYNFDPDNDGGVLMQHLLDNSDETSFVNYRKSVWGVYGKTNTPLAETLADIWYYFKPTKTTKTYYPTDMEVAAGRWGSTPITYTTSASDPIQYWCQKNYVIIMTDGESTEDKFDNGYSSSIFKTKPVKRTEPWTGWDSGWGDPDLTDQSNGIPKNYDSTTATYCPNNTCWLKDSGGSDYLDDVAYFLRHQDLMPDASFGTDPETGWPGTQNILTYTIGFTADNHMLEQTALNGDGAYFTANNYEELVTAFTNVITSINLRNYGFSAITAPKKTATATNEEMTMSYVGYFMPAALSQPFWEGHLLAFKLVDKWGFDSDVDANNVVDQAEFVYSTQEECLNASNGKTCERTIYLSMSQEWDAVDKLPASGDDRNIYTHDSTNTSAPYEPFTFSTSNISTLRPLINSSMTDAQMTEIISKVRANKDVDGVLVPQLGDIYHSDVTFVGPPPFGKQYITNLKPKGTLDQSYSDYYTANENRAKVLYVGTNDGIFHMLRADGVNAGSEVWGLVPDSALPTLKTMVIDSKKSYTVDGRITVNDVYYPNSSGNNYWHTLLTFGLRQGGNAFYALDATEVSTSPNILWKFQDPAYSGQSWCKPVIGRIQYYNGTTTVDKWVVIVTGGFAFNPEFSDDKKGKAIFVLDAKDGSILWMLGYDSINGASDDSSYPNVVQSMVDPGNSHRYYTKSSTFNFPFPSSLTAIDADNNGYLDAIYYGNVGGFLFKTNIAKSNISDWKTTRIYETTITTKATATIKSISGYIHTVNENNSGFEVGDTVIGLTSRAYGYVEAIKNADITINITTGTFVVGETIRNRTYDPIYLSPALAYDQCFQMWLAFGTGDRDRPRTSVKPGRFISFIDRDVAYTLSSLIQLTWTGTTTPQLTPDTITGYGWYFNFATGGEKLFDPEPIILPDSAQVPHIMFNTFTPASTVVSNKVNPCNVPKEGTMTLYDIAFKCTLSSTGAPTMGLTGDKDTGRIAGGGIYQGKEYVVYNSSSGKVADVPGSEGGNFSATPKRLPFPGGVVFWTERKR